jgi:uncharacterized membrane protein
MDHGTLIPADRTRAVTRALLAASAICFALLVMRAVLAQEVRWTGFFGNLVLAWIPFVFARLLCGELDRPGRRRWLLGGLFAGWVLFFPNAAYIVTDLVHLKNRPPVPRWFDYILITAYAWTGLFLCYVSLRLLHARVQQWWGVRIGWAFVTAMLAAGSFGIYVGRFFRWNSWDVLLRPWKPLRDLAKFSHPATLLEAMAFCATFFLLSVMVYVVLHALAHLHAPVPVEERERQ